MADKNRYPQIPSTVWWGVRSILNRTPNATIDERLLGVQLAVQEAAARAYVTELKSAGILSDEGKATPLANKWRLDDTYGEAVEKIIATVYPDSLRQVAPPADADRQKVVSWFMREGLGKGAAGNKAATYLLIGSPSPNDGTAKATKTRENTSNSRRTSSSRAAAAGRSKPGSRAVELSGDAARRPSGVETLPLNVNVQIHISADAGSEQIETIFSAMRRYLYDAPHS